MRQMFIKLNFKAAVDRTVADLVHDASDPALILTPGTVPEGAVVAVVVMVAVLAAPSRVVAGSSGVK